VHGFVFFALRQTLQFAAHTCSRCCRSTSGVGLGRLLVLIVLIPALGLLFRYVVDEDRTIILSASSRTASHWLGERWELLRKFRFEWPAIDAAFLAGALRWMMLLVAAAALYWFVFGVLRPPRNLKSEI
jgi:hypothetical protein